MTIDVAFLPPEGIFHKIIKAGKVLISSLIIVALLGNDVSMAVGKMGGQDDEHRPHVNLKLPHTEKGPSQSSTGGFLRPQDKQEILGKVAPPNGLNLQEENVYFYPYDPEFEDFEEYPTVPLLGRKTSTSPTLSTQSSSPLQNSSGSPEKDKPLTSSNSSTSSSPDSSESAYPYGLEDEKNAKDSSPPKTPKNDISRTQRFDENAGLLISGWQNLPSYSQGSLNGKEMMVFGGELFPVVPLSSTFPNVKPLFDDEIAIEIGTGPLGLEEAFKEKSLLVSSFKNKSLLVVSSQGKKKIEEFSEDFRNILRKNLHRVSPLRWLGFVIALWPALSKALAWSSLTLWALDSPLTARFVHGTTQSVEGLAYSINGSETILSVFQAFNFFILKGPGTFSGKSSVGEKLKAFSLAITSSLLHVFLFFQVQQQHMKVTKETTFPNEYYEYYLFIAPGLLAWVMGETLVEFLKARGEHIPPEVEKEVKALEHLKKAIENNELSDVEIEELYKFLHEPGNKEKFSDWAQHFFKGKDLPLTKEEALSKWLVLLDVAQQKQCGIKNQDEMESHKTTGAINAKKLASIISLLGRAFLMSGITYAVFSSFELPDLSPEIIAATVGSLNLISDYRLEKYGMSEIHELKNSFRPSVLNVMSYGCGFLYNLLTNVGVLAVGFYFLLPDIIGGDEETKTIVGASCLLIGSIYVGKELIGGTSKIGQSIVSILDFFVTPVGKFIWQLIPRVFYKLLDLMSCGSENSQSSPPSETLNQSDRDSQKNWLYGKIEEAMEFIIFSPEGIQALKDNRLLRE